MKASTGLITHNKARVVNKIPSLSKDLKAAHETTMHLTTTPQIWECVDKLHEAKLILASIQKKISLGEAVPSDFAILYRTRSHGESIIDLIKRSGLEYDTADDSNNLLVFNGVDWFITFQIDIEYKPKDKQLSFNQMVNQNKNSIINFFF
jgi:superfamily I DNA/RNA helicase